MNIDMNELVMTISAFTRALSKIGSGIVPNKSTISAVASQIFIEIDKDENKNLALEEIQIWAENNEELQEIMAILSNRQSYHLAKIRYEKKIESYNQLFQKHSQIIEGDKFAPKSLIVAELQGLQEIQELDNSEFEMLLTLMSDQNSDLLSEDNYIEAIKDWLAYYVSDFLKAGKLDKAEIRVLMSFQKNNEITLDKVEEVMREIDIEKKGFITRKQ